MSPTQSADSPSTPSALSTLSSQLAAAVETAESSVVAIHARQRIPSSGILWRDGLVISASHTVKRDDDISLTLSNGTTARATIAGRDVATDLVALRIEKNAGAAAGARADADAARVGALVLAVGRPGRKVTASFGIVSAIGEGWRTWHGTRIDQVFRLDLSVYDGFSGGPLVAPSGAVIGMNNSALSRGTPMTLPARVVDQVVDELLQRGHVRRPFIGVAVQPVALPAPLVREHQLTRATALLIMSVAEGSPAERAGLYVGDALVEAEGKALEHPTDLLDLLSGVGDGAPVALKYLRGGAIRSASLTPADRAAATR